MDVVKEWADMVHCRPVDLGNSFAKRLLKLEALIRDDERRKRVAHKRSKKTYVNDYLNFMARGSIK